LETEAAARRAALAEASSNYSAAGGCLCTVYSPYRSLIRVPWQVNDLQECQFTRTEMSEVERSPK
jgi:hypothetical protein